MPRTPKKVTIDISIDYGEEIVFESFTNVYSFAEYLKANPEIAQQVAYNYTGRLPTIKRPVGTETSVYKRTASQYNGGKKAAMQFKAEVRGAIDRGEMTMPKGWDKNLP